MFDFFKKYQNEKGAQKFYGEIPSEPIFYAEQKHRMQVEDDIRVAAVHIAAQIESSGNAMQPDSVVQRALSIAKGIYNTPMEDVFPLAGFRQPPPPRPEPKIPDTDLHP